jgi:hypothetical protein
MPASHRAGERRGAGALARLLVDAGSGARATSRTVDLAFAARFQPWLCRTPSASSSSPSTISPASPIP